VSSLEARRNYLLGPYRAVTQRVRPGAWLKQLLTARFKPAEDEKAILPVVRRIVKDHWRPYALRYTLAVLSMMLVAGMTALSAYLMKDVVDSIFVHQNRTALYEITALIVVIFTAKGFASYVSEVLVGSIGNRLVAHSQTRLFDHLLKADVGFFEKHPSSDIIMRMSYSANAARDVLNLVSLTFGRDLFTLCSLVGTMVLLDPFMTALAFIGGPIAVMITRRLVARIQAAARSEAHSIAGIINTAREMSQGVQVVKSFQLEERMRHRMDLSVSAVERLSNKMLRIGASVNPLIDTLGGFSVALVVFYAGWRNINFGDTPGQFFAFITALLMCADPARRLSRVRVSLATAALNARMMYEVLDTPAREAEHDDLPDLRVRAGDIRFDKVEFGYQQGTPVINALSLHVPAGKTTALVGQSGGGKSTIMALLQRFREPDSGEILIDGTPIRSVSRKSLRRNLTMVGQDVFLFQGSVCDNIIAGCPEASQADCIAAAQAARAHLFIEELPEGYDTQVGELGNRVSGGQRQRIALARAILKSAPIILLDEPTSALDSETETFIQRELKELSRGKTVLVIAHRLSTILHADLIHVIQDGRVVESGKHAELLARGGAYSRLYQLQFRGQSDESERAAKSA
jgi:ATP-binding cassette subfamily B protein